MHAVALSEVPLGILEILPKNRSTDVGMLLGVALRYFLVDSLQMQIGNISRSFLLEFFQKVLGDLCKRFSEIFSNS